MEGFELVALGDAPVEVDITLTSQPTEATEAVNNLIFLSRHTPGSDTSCDKTSQSPGNVKTVTAIVSSLEDVVNRGLKQYHCSLCNATDDSDTNLYKHMISAHKGITIRKNDGSLWTSSHDSSKASRLTYHPLTNHDNKTKNSKVIRVIKTSQRERDRGEKHYQCSACGYVNNSTSNIYKHMKSRHSSCQFQKVSQHLCKKLTGLVVNHARTIFKPGPVVKVEKATKEGIIRGEMTYRCSACGKPSNTTSNLYKHMEKVHRDHTIEKINRLDTSIRRGQRSEANALRTDGQVVRIVKSSPEEIARGEKVYKCSECGKGSECTGNLYAHMDVSHPECTVQLFKPPIRVPFPSDQTGDERFVRVVKATRNGKPFYKCSKCYMVSSCTSNLYKHMRRLHKGFTIIKKTKAICGSRGNNITVENSCTFENDDDNNGVVIDDIGIAGTIPKLQSSITGGGDCVGDNFNSYECSVCMETFNSCSDLDSHVKVHEGDDSNRSQLSGHDGDDGSDFETDEMRGVGDLGNLEEREISGEGEGDVISEEREEIAEEFELDGEGIEDEGECSGNVGEERGDGGDILSERPGAVVSTFLNQFDDFSHSHGGVHTSLVNEKGDNVNPLAGAGSRPVQGHSENDKIVTVTVVKTTKEERNSGEKWYRCSLCGKASDFTSNLYKHMKSEHKDCVIRKITAGSKRDKETGSNPKCGDQIVKVIVTPANQRKKRGDKIYSCSECGHTDNVISHLYQHMHNEHKGFIIQRLTGRDSDETNDLELGQSYNRIVRVMKVGEEGENVYQCSQCSFGSAMVGRVYSHVKICHKGFVIGKMQDLTGSLPPESDSHGDTAVWAIRSSPSEIRKGFRKYRCSRCHYSNDSSSSLYKHMKRSHGECLIEKVTEIRRYYDHCDKKNDKRVRDKVGVISIHNEGGRLYKCSKCERTSSCTSNLYKHMKFAHKECAMEKLQEVNHAYDRCAKDSRLDGRFVRAINMPKDDKGRPCYKCSKCSHTSNNTSNLYKHMKRLHSEFAILKKIQVNDERTKWYSDCDDSVDEVDASDDENLTVCFPLGNFASFECSLCMETFSSCSDLDQHTKTEHPS